MVESMNGYGENGFAGRRITPESVGLIRSQLYKQLRDEAPARRAERQQQENFASCLKYVDADKDGSITLSELSETKKAFQGQIEYLHEFKSAFPERAEDCDRYIEIYQTQMENLASVRDNFDQYSEENNPESINTNNISNIVNSIYDSNSEEDDTIGKTEDLLNIISYADEDKSGGVTRNEITQVKSSLQEELASLNDLKTKYPGYGEYFDGYIKAYQSQIQNLDFINTNFDNISRNGDQDVIDNLDLISLIASASSDGHSETFSQRDFDSLIA